MSDTLIRAWPYPVRAEDVALAVTHFGQPLPKERPRFGRRGAYTSGRTAAYERGLRALYLSATPPACDGAARFALRCVFYRGTHRRVDLDNLVKAVADAANGLVWADDSQVVEVCARLHKGCDVPRAEILIHHVG